MKNILKWIEKNLGKLGYVLLPLTWVDHDKQKHALIGIWFGAAGFMVSQFWVTQNWITALCGMAVSLIVGYLIEVYQKTFNKGVYDLKDMWATLYGGIFINIVFLLIWQNT